MTKNLNEKWDDGSLDELVNSIKVWSDMRNEVPELVQLIKWLRSTSIPANDVRERLREEWLATAHGATADGVITRLGLWVDKLTEGGLQRKEDRS